MWQCMRLAFTFVSSAASAALYRLGCQSGPTPITDTGTPAALVAAGFHESLGRATAGAAAELAAKHGLSTVALSGGVFQNVRLAEVVVGELSDEGLEVLVHRQVPPNDGGISVGQAAIAAAAALPVSLSR